MLVRYVGVSAITWQYARAGGVRYRSTLLLTTIGRRTGALRPRALPYHRDGDRYVVIGSNGGGPTDPDWVGNVREDPTAWIHVRRRSIPVRAHVAEGAERERLFALIGETGDSLARYQRARLDVRTHRSPRGARAPLRGRLAQPRRSTRSPPWVPDTRMASTMRCTARASAKVGVGGASSGIGTPSMRSRNRSASRV